MSDFEHKDIVPMLESTRPTVASYRGYSLRLEVGPRRALRDWRFEHEEYDGPGDRRLGFARTLTLALRAIDELEVEYGDDQDGET